MSKTTLQTFGASDSKTPIISAPLGDTDGQVTPGVPAIPGTKASIGPLPVIPGPDFPVPPDTSAEDSIAEAQLRDRVEAARRAAALIEQGRVETAIGQEHTDALKEIMADPGGKLAYNILLGISEACAKQPEDSVLSRLGPLVSKLVGWDLLDQFEK